MHATTEDTSSSPPDENPVQRAMRVNVGQTRALHIAEQVANADALAALLRGIPDGRR